MKKTLLIGLASLLVASTVTLASGSSGSSGVPPASDPYTTTATAECIVAGIKEDGTVLVRPKDCEEIFRLALTDKTHFSAANKKDFGGRKKIKVIDLKVGHHLKVVTKAASGEVLRVKVLKT